MMTRTLYGGTAILAITTLVFTGGVSQFLFSSPPCVTPLNTLGDFEKQGLSIYVEMNKYLISVTLIIAGLAGGFVLSVMQRKYPISIWALLLTFISFALVFISLYFGYVSYFSIFEGVVNKCFDLNGDRLKYPQLIQYYSMLAALLSGIGVVVTQIFKNLQQGNGD